MALYWRKDGLPLWKDTSLLADISKDYGYTIKDAEIFLQSVSRKLGVNPDNISPGYEDVFYYLWTEQKLPVNITPYNVNLKDSLERRELMEQLNRGLDEPSGFVIPLQWAYPKNGWISCKWEFRGGRIMLIPGKSQLGYRLPLKSLPYMEENKKAKKYERSLFADTDPLEDFHAKIAQREAEEPDYSIPEEMLNPVIIDHKKKEDESEKKRHLPFKEKEEKEDSYKPKHEVFTIYTALSSKIREGKLYLLLPPTDLLEYYLDILAAIEITAKELNIKVVIEG